ncbi:MAG TPA: class I SAM-dependent methyltransferase [Candidatus Binatia bacterium]|nr:class I SAM-dependent methyltransferase [Candidatus Binatia bacterium]
MYSTTESDTTLRQLSKYNNTNPIHRIALNRFFDRIVEALRAIAPQSVLDFGCGEGLFLQELEQRGLRFPHYTGLDLREDALAMARSLHPERQFLQGDVMQWSAPDAAFDLVIASQVLEHLPEAGRVLDRLVQLSTRHLLLTVPWEPWFRTMNLLRGRDLRRFGNHPEHVNLWAVRRFRAFVSQHATVLRVMTAFPFIIVIAAPSVNSPAESAGRSR